MMIKIVSLLAIFGAASAGISGYATHGAYNGYNGYAAPIAAYQPAAAVVRAEPYDPHPQYSYGYSVQDGYTGDSKSHSESRDGDVVKGQYSLVEPDGAVRTVTYTADSINGFNAVVDRSAPVAAIAKVAAPQVIRSALPVYNPGYNAGYNGYAHVPAQAYANQVYAPQVYSQQAYAQQAYNQQAYLSPYAQQVRQYY